MLRIDQVDLDRKKILIRLDLNVPRKNNKILDLTRILAQLDTIKYAIAQHAAIILMGHLGDPDLGNSLAYKNNYSNYSLASFVPILEKLLAKPIKFLANWYDLNSITMAAEEIVLCENTRFSPWEKINDPAFAKKIAGFADLFVLEAFSCAHRKHASNYGVLAYTKLAVLGFAFAKEIAYLQKLFLNPARPLIAVVGGNKIATKLNFLAALSKIADQILVGGKLANFCLTAKRSKMATEVPKNELSLTWQDLIYSACLALPIDAVVRDQYSHYSYQNIASVRNLEHVVDLGNKTIINYQKILTTAKTIIWNGPLGMYEDLRSAVGTKSLAKFISQSSATSIIGGGDTVSAINLFKLTGFTYISTGGGAFLQYITDHTLPGLELLN